MKKNPLIRTNPRKTNTTGGHKSAGILDDYAIRKVTHTKEGTIEHTPTNDSDITNKKYVDDQFPVTHESTTDKNSNATYQHITTTQETNFETAYTHSQDNTQAHSDYLLNNANDSTTYQLTMGKAVIDNVSIDGDTITDNDDNGLNLYHSYQHTSANETGISILSNNPGGAMDYAGDINIGITDTPCYGGGDVNIYSQGGDGTGGGKINLIAKPGMGFKGGQIHIYSKNVTYGADNLYLQEEGGDVVIGASAPTGCKLGLQGDDGGPVLASPKVVTFLGGQARQGAGSAGSAGGDTTIEATDEGVKNSHPTETRKKPKITPFRS